MSSFVTSCSSGNKAEVKELWALLVGPITSMSNWRNSLPNRSLSWEEVGSYTKKENLVHGPCTVSADLEVEERVRLIDCISLMTSQPYSVLRSAEKAGPLLAQPANQVLAGPFILARLNPKRGLCCIFTSFLLWYLWLSTVPAASFRPKVPSHVLCSVSAQLCFVLAQWEEIPCPQHSFQTITISL